MEEEIEIKRLVQHEGATDAEPRTEHAAEAASIHHRKGAQQDVISSDLWYIDHRAKHTAPVSVGPKHSLWSAFSPGGPTDGDRIVGLDGDRRHMGHEGRCGLAAGRSVQFGCGRWNVVPKCQHPRELRQFGLEIQDRLRI